MMNGTYIHRRQINPLSPMEPTWQGTISRKITVAGVERSVLYYIPEHTMASTAGVVLIPPGGVAAEEFLNQSNWRMLADTEERKEKMILCVLESGGERWELGELYGRLDGDVAYIHGACADFCRRDLFCVHESQYYMVGYGDGGVMAQMAAMADPAFYAGIVCVGDGGVAEAFRSCAGADWCTNLDGFEDLDHQLNLRKKEIPLPVWQIQTAAGKSQEDLEYWKAACGADYCQRIDRDTVTYLRSQAPRDALNQDREAHRVWHSVIPDGDRDFGALLNRRIWKDFLCGVRRWMSEPGGSLRMAQDPVRDLGCEYHYEQVGGWMREWYVYVPKWVQQHPETPVPVVFANHGYTCSGEIYIGNSGWDRVAEQERFLLIAATGPYDYIEGKGENQASKFENTQLPAWNIFGKQGLPDEIDFFLHMLQDVKTRFAIDEERVYATGHSWGSMMTHYLGMALPDVFAAIAPCSGVLFDEHGETMLKNPQVLRRPVQAVPVWMFVGENEPWLFPHLPAGENAPARSIRLWWNRNQMEGTAPESFETGWQTRGRWNDLTYNKHGCPMIRYTWVRSLPHATMPEMSWRIWKEFFSYLRKDRITGEVVWTVK